MPNARPLIVLALVLVACHAPAARAQADPAEPIKPIARRLPPPGVELPAETRAALTQRLTTLQQKLDMLPTDAPGRADAAVYLKAVRFALEIGEFYDLKKDVPKAERALNTAEQRISALVDGKAPWHDWDAQRGTTIVLGHVSAIDGSVQPLGVTIPPGLDLTKPVPLHIFLHGRGDKTTDLHFVDQLEAGKCVWKSDKAIVLEPFGRQCIGWKGPGEVDVFEAIERVKALLPIDEDRIALIGFSMGGAGAWHIGAHHADRFCIVAPGAGFAETREYLRLADDQLPGEVERLMWGVNDAPAYVRNLFNTRVVAYSGEDDKQKQAADRMGRAFQEEGRELRHLIGPGTGHKYHPETLKELHAIVDAAVEQGRDPMPKTVHLQTRTLRYNTMHWVRLIAMQEQWRDTRIDAEWTDENTLVITTRNVETFTVDAPSDESRRGDTLTVIIDGQRLTVPFAELRAPVNGFNRAAKGWRFGHVPMMFIGGVPKRPGTSGPVDDVFVEPFLFVLPSKPAEDPLIQRWIASESKHQIRRWRELMRGDPRVKQDIDVTKEDRERFHLVCWGTPSANRLIELALPELPIEWSARDVKLGGHAYDATRHVPIVIYPHVFEGSRYVVLNSGPTFREADDRTNSLQNPKLGDWAVVDVTVDPSAEAPGRVVESGVFNGAWEVE